MAKLSTTIKPSDPDYKTNFEHNKGLAEELASRQKSVAPVVPLVVIQ